MILPERPVRLSPQNFTLYPAPMGALTQLYAGTMPEGANLGGQVRVSCSFTPDPCRMAYTCIRTPVPDSVGEGWEGKEGDGRSRCRS